MGYQTLSREGFDRELALFPKEVLAFLQGTQPKAWEKLEQLHGKKLPPEILLPHQGLAAG